MITEAEYPGPQSRQQREANTFDPDFPEMVVDFYLFLQSQVQVFNLHLLWLERTRKKKKGKM